MESNFEQVPENNENQVSDQRQENGSFSSAEKIVTQEPKKNKKRFLKFAFIGIAIIIVVGLFIPSGPDFNSIYNSYCSSEFADVSNDGSYLSIDTNPNDLDDYMDYDAYYAIQEVHKALGLPESLFEKMSKTRALDGTQSQNFDNVIVSWTYHPDKGLNVTYEKK